MTATILSFFRFKTNSSDWTQEELSEFYRVEAAMQQCNMRVVTDRGVSDEGDPWFVFCREDNGEIIAHFARIEKQYVIVASSFSNIARGPDFRALISELMRGHPLMLSGGTANGQNVFIHPAALFMALVATSFVMSFEKDVHNHKGGESEDQVRLFSLSDFAMLSALAIAVTCVENQLDSGLRFTQTDRESDLHDHGSSPSGTMLHGNHIQLDDVFGNTSHKFITEMSASGFNLAWISPGQDSLPFQTHVPLFVGEPPLGNSDHAVLSSTLEVVSHWLYGVDAVPAARIPVSELSFNAGSSAIPFFAKSSQPTPTSSSQNINDFGSGSSVGSIEAFKTLFGSTEALRTLNSELSLKDLTLVILTPQNISLGNAIQMAMSHLGYQTAQNLAGNFEQNSVETDPGHILTDPGHILTDPGHILAHPPGPPPLVANLSVLTAFIQQTPHFQIDVVGRNLVVVDMNTNDISNSDFGRQTWSMADGSTLTIVGIIPHVPHMSHAEAGVVI